MKKLLYLMAFLIASHVVAQDYSRIAKDYLESNRSQWGLNTMDVATVKLSSQTHSKSMNLENVYVNQVYNGIEVFNSTSSFAVKNGNVVSAKVAFIANLAAKVNSSTPSITAASAISSAAQSLGQTVGTLQLLGQDGFEYQFNDGGISLNHIPVKLVYQPLENGTVRLAWDLSIYLLDASHYYSLRVDALNGQVIDTMDWVVSCDFESGAHAHKVSNSALFKNEALALGGGAQYRVFPLPFRNPADVADQIVTSPEDLTASPFGWHDTDGSGGAEFTITRGNNVWAQEDINGNNGTGASPDGGATLDFDFPYGLPQDPSNFTDAATVNLFYWNNIIHDVTYQYGFDEESGNFQENNYGNPGNESDSVNADAQDGSGTNNANFSTPPDGNNPRMQMFIWSGGSAPTEILTINAGPLAGTYEGVAAAFGAPMPVPAITEDIVVVEDDNSGTSTDPYDACDPITNGASLSGKIAILNRGECEFGFKALAAENEGAIAVIVVDRPSPSGNQYPLIMGAGAVGNLVTIPVFMVSETNGDAIINDILSNGPRSGTITGENIPDDLDGDLDNEIVIHEYGHGVSNRLTGGPTNTGCLQNQEQMGEGWSDYLALVMTMYPGDQPEDIRGMASYASGNPNGLREAPYSTDFAINDYTYADINGNVTIPHGVGFVWATMLWEMTWNLIDEYGYDPDIYNGTGGNNLALQLVMDGMKLQPCSPGFVDGRDAILEADMLTNGGANQCAIWRAFAKRGLGVSAIQGSTSSVFDGTEAYDVPSECELGVGDFNFENNFQVYPNPSQGTINIASKVSLGLTEVAIYDMNGRKVFSQSVEIGNQVSLDASQLSAGVYLVKVDGGNYTFTTKLIMR
ncbi:MAG TPA: T9SS-dependent M36 family metallopeptidase [Flavobacteriaceae bacterium]|nr:T9SS-dependent M36 family metallopeptidase [Flavobacteriaceae bacterium]MCB9212193.1 T9SS-dependent M36 family metallopeptidase [Alteromonas sp.]HPF10429.1 T9SS-dependent M36 family metallopeptidase [Flavobacteriaceae bacterium]HQU20493.1 T9SS-dependent M36 family metallopeptidase [Flavobacteriaceae bacterium]HQU64640.1 T9SS-dependent M36 family metallopeptidase [Flavobacteriaceae bacterium]